MSDLLRTQLQETGHCSVIGKTLAQVVSIVTDLGIDPHDVRFPVYGEIAVRERPPNRGVFNDVEPDDMSDHPDHPDAA